METFPGRGGAQIAETPRPSRPTSPPAGAAVDPCLRAYPVGSWGARIRTGIARTKTVSPAVGRLPRVADSVDLRHDSQALLDVYLRIAKANVHMRIVSGRSTPAAAALAQGRRRCPPA